MPRLEWTRMGSELGAEADVYMSEEPSIQDQTC